MAFEFEGYNFEGYSGPKPFVCDPVLPAKTFCKKKSIAFGTSQSVYLYKMLANDIARGPLLCCTVKPMLAVQQFLNKQNKSDLI